MPRPNIAIRPPAERASGGAQALRHELGPIARIVRRSPVPRQYRTVINWGNSSTISTSARVLNLPSAIELASNKLSAFQVWQREGVNIPQFTTDTPEIHSGEIYLARTALRGSCGVGIQVLRPGDAIPPAPLYVRYVRKQIEYRLHVVNGEVIFAQRKRKRSEFDQTVDQRLIRNYDNGWVFCPVDVDSTIPDAYKQEAVRAVQTLGLNFGAVDCVVGNRDSQLYILEVNTAPGLESPGLIAAYAQAFRHES